MFHIKICGIRSLEQAQWAADAGADAIGLNFVAQSRRSISPAKAASITLNMRHRVRSVGLFVNSPLAEIQSCWHLVGYDVLQLHGDEPPETLARLRESPMATVPVIRAFRLRTGGLDQIAEYLEKCRTLGVSPRWVLLDAYTAEQYGGTGETCDWETARLYHTLNLPPSLILAGGLVAENVGKAITAVQPLAVDVASGVEDEAGNPSRAMMERFVREARKAFDPLHRD